MSPQDAVILLNGLDISEVVINSVSDTPKPKKSRAKRSVKKLEKEVVDIATDTVNTLDKKITDTYSATASTTVTTSTDEAFAAMGSPWKD